MVTGDLKGKTVFFVTSTITLLEVLVKPLKENKPAIAEQYKTILTSSKNIEIIDIDVMIASRAAGLRAKYNLKTPDSLQLAVATEYNAHLFLTNDVRLSNVKEIRSVFLQNIQ